MTFIPIRYQDELISLFEPLIEQEAAEVAEIGNHTVSLALWFSLCFLGDLYLNGVGVGF